MVITLEDYEGMRIDLIRRLKTDDYEEYMIISDELAAGEPIYEKPEGGEESISKSEYSVVGFCTVVYVEIPLAKKRVTGYLLLNEKWEEEAYNKLVEHID